MFFAIATTIVVAIHFYIWSRLVRDTALPAPWRLIATLVLVVLCASIPALFWFRRERGAIEHLKWIVYPWMGLAVMLFFLLLAGDIARVALWLADKIGGRPPDPSRRLFFSRVIGGGVAALATV